MRVQKLITILDFKPKNFIDKNSSQIKFPPLRQHFIENLMQSNSKGDKYRNTKRFILCTQAQFSCAGSHIVINNLY